eukprot:PhM_4_TR8311/c0_g1_i1/m.77720
MSFNTADKDKNGNNNGVDSNDNDALCREHADVLNRRALPTFDSASPKSTAPSKKSITSLGDAAAAVLANNNSFSNSSFSGPTSSSSAPGGGGGGGLGTAFQTFTSIFERKGNILSVTRAKGAYTGQAFTMDPRTHLPIITVSDTIKPPKCCLDFAIIHFFDKVRKINKRGAEQERLLCISATMVHTVDPKSGVIVRCFPVIEIERVLFDPTIGLLGLVVPSEYDLVFKSTRSEEILKILRAINEYWSSQPLTATPCSLSSAAQVMEVLKPEKTKDFHERFDPLPSFEDIEVHLRTASSLAGLSRDVRSRQATIEDLQKTVELKTQEAATGNDFKEAILYFAQELETYVSQMVMTDTAMSNNDFQIQSKTHNTTIQSIVSSITKAVTAAKVSTTLCTYASDLQLLESQAQDSMATSMSLFEALMQTINTLNNSQQILQDEFQQLEQKHEEQLAEHTQLKQKHEEQLAEHTQLKQKHEEQL